jgi:FkbM family methyltransferase
MVMIALKPAPPGSMLSAMSAWAWRTSAISSRLTHYPRIHRLARRAAKVSRFYLRRPHEADFRAFADLADDGLFLDVGANVGQSAMSFRLFNRASPIVSLEPNPTLRPELAFLKRWVLRENFSYHMVGASAECGSRRLFVPYVDRSPITGEASFIPEQAAALWWNGGREPTLRAYDVEVISVDSLDLPRVAYIKIDVEGTADDVVRGALRTIERDRPVLLVEGPEVVDLVEPLGYAAFSYEDGRFRPYRSGPVAFMLAG